MTSELAIFDRMMQCAKDAGYRYTVGKRFSVYCGNVRRRFGREAATQLLAEATTDQERDMYRRFIAQYDRDDVVRAEVRALNAKLRKA